MARRWRSLSYRDPPSSVAARTAGTGRARGARDPLRRPGGCATYRRSSPPLSGRTATRSSSPASPTSRRSRTSTAETRSPTNMLRSLAKQVVILHAAGISHGRLNASNVLVVEERARCSSTLGMRRSVRRSRRSTSTSPSCSSRAPCSSGPSGRSAPRSTAAGERGDRGCPAVPAAGRADATPARPRTHARDRPEGAPSRRP